MLDIVEGPNNLGLSGMMNLVDKLRETMSRFSVTSDKAGHIFVNALLKTKCSIINDV